MRYDSYLEVNLGQLSSNIEQIKELAPSNEIIYMVKADAYGHGANKLVHFIDNEFKNSEFGVACIGEGLALRKNIPSGKFPLYIFSDLSFSDKDKRQLYLDFNLKPVISSLVDLKTFLEDGEFKHVPLILKFNTGMNRLGIELSEIEEVIKLLKSHGRLELEHCLSHFSSASLDATSNNKMISQKENFQKIKKELRASGVTINQTSLANSGAIEQKYALEESHIRPGLMLYGPSSLIPKYADKSHYRGKCISALKALVVRTDLLERGTPVGYGATPTNEKGLFVQIALGYGDGLLTHYQGASISYKGHAGKFVGRVNMDLAGLLFSSAAKNDIRSGSVIDIWSNNEDMLELSNHCRTIPYQLFCGVSNRVTRKHRL